MAGRFNPPAEASVSNPSTKQAHQVVLFVFLYRDVKYGDLELFLYGLELGDFLELFREQQVDLSLLLTLNEDDLVNVSSSLILILCFLFRRL